MSKSQIHTKFKVFSGQPSPDGLLGGLQSTVEAFTAGKGIAPKSLGIEYVERTGKLVLSLGYRDDEPGYATRLTAVPLGKPATDQEMEVAMSAAAEKVSDVICHEFFVRDDGEVVLVLLSHA